MNRTILNITGVFLIPIIIAVVLATARYTGNTINKGQWVERDINVNEVIDTPIDTSNYAWHILYICQDNCQSEQLIESGLITLGTKAHMTQLTTKHYDQLNDMGKEALKPAHIYLADPHLKLVLSYSESKIIDLIADTKRMLKSVDREKAHSDDNSAPDRGMVTNWQLKAARDGS